jgi:hypothetical protein
MEHAEAPIYHAMVPEQPSPCVMLEGSGIQTTPPQPGPCKGCVPCNPIVKTAGFSYAQTNKANNIKFAHQSFCNPPIVSLLKAINAGFLTGAPHLDSHLVQKYFFASLPTSKGHMKQPCKGVWSTPTTKPVTATQLDPLLLRPQRMEDRTMPGLNHLQPNGDVDNRTTCPPPHLIQEFDDYSIANLFCFGAFADKLLGAVYNDCTGDFPYISLDSNICFFVMYH